MKARYWPCFSVKQGGTVLWVLPELGLIARFVWSPAEGDRNECTVSSRVERGRTPRIEGAAERRQTFRAQAEASADPAGRRCGSLRRRNRPQRRRRWLHRLSHQTPLSAGEPGGGAERRSTARCGAQAERQGGGAADSDCLRQAAGRPGTLDVGAAGRRDGQAD